MKILEYDFKTGEVLDTYNDVTEIERSRARQKVIRRVLKGELNHAYGKGYIDLDTGIEPFEYIRKKILFVENSKKINSYRNKYKSYLR